jgi:acyl carrier protein
MLPEEFKLNRLRLARAYDSGELREADPALRGEGVSKDVLLQRITACFAKALCAEAGEIGADQDFFLDLGGTSLDYFALRAELQDELGVSFPMESAQLHTVRQFADYLRNHREIG